MSDLNRQNRLIKVDCALKCNEKIGDEKNECFLIGD